jgi:hypothetical protein
MSRYSQKLQSAPPTQSISVQSVQNAYLSLRRTQRALVSLLIACAILGMTFSHAAPGTLGRQTYLPVIFSTVLLTFAYTVRNAMVVPALTELRRNPRDAAALHRWSRNNLIVLCLCGAVGMLGFALQLRGAAMPVALTLYAIAISYLFLLHPAKP